MLLGGVKQLGIHEGNVPSKEKATSIAQGIGLSLVFS